MQNESYESIHFSTGLPIKVFMSQHTQIASHWHRSIELLLVLEGQLDIQVDDSRYHLEPEDLILINSNTSHGLDSKGAVSITLQFSPEVFDENPDSSDSLNFECNSAVDPDPRRYDVLRSTIAQLVQNNANINAGTTYKNSAYYYMLIGELMGSFRSPTTESVRSKRRHATRMTSILEYIGAHYRENISLADLAESQHLSIPYLSSFFNRQMGIGFAQYYTNLRLEHAVHDLVGTDSPIEVIAANNGFPESHAFVRAFKKKYGTLPSVFRRERTRDVLVSGSTRQTNYTTLEPTNYLHLLTRYLTPPAQSTQQPGVPANSRAVPSVSAQAAGSLLQHTFRTLTTVGRASDLLRQDILKMLADMQDIVGFRYIKFHGILGDDMMVVSRDEDGKLHFNFSLVDQIIDNLNRLRLRPFIELSFTPSVMASDPGKTIFQQPFNTSPPKDLGEWEQLITELVQHLILRFGKDAVTEWPFSVWCEPDTPTTMFGWNDPDRFCDFYRRTRQAVKAVCPEIRFGSPATLFLRHTGSSLWLRNFFTYVRSHNCLPDFLNLHYYADMLPESTQTPVGMAPMSRFPEDPDDFHGFIDDYRKLAAEFGLGHLKIYLTEWNLTFSHRNLINDTCFKSCYLIKNLLENYDRLGSFGYWSLTDLLSENPLPDDMFHGGMGIYTVNGIRKPAFNALRLAGMLGNELLAQGDGYFITRTGSSIQIMMYHYVHYGSLFAAGEAFNITPLDRYGIFDMSRRLRMAIPLTDLVGKKYLLKEYFVNREHGSAFDHWLGTGALPITPGEAVIMNYACSPGFFQQHIEVPGGEYLYCPTLEPLEVRLAVFRPI